MSQPLISIIIPVYKVESWLDSCVNSVLAQSYSNLEIILVDDGSPDNCGVLCDKWEEKDSRIRAIHKKNGGLSSARNAGLDVATGEYLMFLDSDDVIHPDTCNILYTCIKESNAQIAIGDIVHVFGDETPKYTVSAEQRTMSPTEAIKELWYQKSFLPSACVKLYHQSIFQSLRFTEGLLFEDVDLLHLAFWNAQTLVYTPSALYGYMHRDDSITTKPFNLRDLDILKIADKLLHFADTTAPALTGAAAAYAVTAAMRVALNAPNTQDFAQGHQHAAQLLKTYGKQVSTTYIIRMTLEFDC